MITDFLLEHAALVPAALLAIAVVCVLVGVVTLRARRQGVLRALVVVSALAVVALTLVPAGGDPGDRGCTVQFFVPTLGSVELLANVALLFPLTFFSALASRRPVVVLAAATVLSALIEALQAVVPAIGRACDTNDWAMNTAGALVAAALAAATLSSRRSRWSRSAGPG